MRLWGCTFFSFYASFSIPWNVKVPGIPLGEGQAIWRKHKYIGMEMKHIIPFHILYIRIKHLVLPQHTAGWETFRIVWPLSSNNYGNRSTHCLCHKSQVNPSARMVNFDLIDSYPIRIKNNQEENMKNANCNLFRTGELFSTWASNLNLHRGSCPFRWQAIFSYQNFISLNNK